MDYGAIYEEGQRHASLGLPASENPYSNGGSCAKAWLAGHEWEIEQGRKRPDFECAQARGEEG